MRLPSSEDKSVPVVNLFAYECSTILLIRSSKSSACCRGSWPSSAGFLSFTLNIRVVFSAITLTIYFPPMRARHQRSSVKLLNCIGVSLVRLAGAGPTTNGDSKATGSDRLDAVRHPYGRSVRRFLDL